MKYEFTESFTSNHFNIVLEYIHDNYAHSITLEDLSNQVAISTFHFAKLFKQVIGLSPYQFILTFRVEQAKIMLTNPKRSLSEIALLCGFSDQAHFSRVFKSRTGTPPSAWKNYL